MVVTALKVTDTAMLADQLLTRLRAQAEGPRLTVEFFKDVDALVALGGIGQEMAEKLLVELTVTKFLPKLNTVVDQLRERGVSPADWKDFKDFERMLVEGKKAAWTKPGVLLSLPGLLYGLVCAISLFPIYYNHAFRCLICRL